DRRQQGAVALLGNWRESLVSGQYAHARSQYLQSQALDIFPAYNVEFATAILNPHVSAYLIKLAHLPGRHKSDRHALQSHQRLSPMQKSISIDRIVQPKGEVNKPVMPCRSLCDGDCLHQRCL